MIESNRAEVLARSLPRFVLFASHLVRWRQQRRYVGSSNLVGSTTESVSGHSAFELPK